MAFPPDTGIMGVALGLVGPVSVYCDWVGYMQCYPYIPVWQHIKLVEVAPSLKWPPCVYSDVKPYQLPSYQAVNELNGCQSVIFSAKVRKIRHWELRQPGTDMNNAPFIGERIDECLQHHGAISSQQTARDHHWTMLKQSVFGETHFTLGTETITGRSLCGPVVKVSASQSGGRGSIPGRVDT